MTKIKICGLSRPCDIETANECRPDYIGFIFAKSPRQTSVGQARKLKAALSPEIRTVGVFVREELPLVAALLEEGLIDAAQLHGGEDETYVRTLQKRTGKPVWKAFSIRSAEDAMRAEESAADLLLFDHGAGGTGQTFDWSCLRRVSRPYFLAGGLGSANVVRAIEELRPYGLDLNSGVETDGKKDPEKIRECVRRIRNV